MQTEQIIHDVLITQFVKMLKNLDKILDKGMSYAAVKKFEPDVLLHSRLAPDQFPLIKQIQIATDAAKLCAFRLTGKTAPTHDDQEKSFPELKTRIQQVISYLASITPQDLKGIHDKKITQPRWEGKYLMGWEYASQHSVPNVYFHITAAYEILRHNGVDVGKSDYLGELPFKS